MATEHKEKLAQGRADARAVKSYLTYLDENKPKRGRRRTPETIAQRLETLQQELATSNPLARLNLIQEQMNLEVELERLKNVPDDSSLRAGFIDAAARYSTSKGISRDAFRAVGVDAATLTEAGIR